MSLQAPQTESARLALTRDMTPSEFFSLVSVDSPDTVQGVVFPSSSGRLTEHVWNLRGEDFGSWAEAKTKDREPAYFTMGAFDPGSVSDHRGRTKANVRALRGFWVDVEGTEAKGGYEGEEAVREAVRAFIKVSKLIPNAVVQTGSGGVHLHYLLTDGVPVSDWFGRARALVATAAKHGFKIDAQCTTDAARIMRAPGSKHQKTGKVVKARRGRSQTYTPAQFDELVGYEPGTALAPASEVEQFDLSVNSDVLEDVHSLFSYTQAAQKCAAMQQAARDNGARTQYPVWILALRAADIATEGRDFAHQISSGYTAYDEGETDRKLESLTGGPAGCAAWAAAYGAGGPCDTCELKGHIRNPAVQLGAIVNTAPPGQAAASGDSVPQWVAELNARFALARIGSSVIVVDFETPGVVSGGAVQRGVGYLEVAGFHKLLGGRFVPTESPRDKPRTLSHSWLAHTGRRQYEGVVFAPGEALPADMLNTWQGFAVKAAPGDVSPWLEVLQALVPTESDREYVLRWLAWKVQNPGGVPDTILIFRGAKGTGKNSLFNPLLAAFGRHAMLADDPELIAGRFTGHLMNLAFAVLDEAVFVGDPRQADRIKSRITAKTMHYEQKGMEAISGVNRCAYVMLTNHAHVWQATTDERRAVVINVGEAMRAKQPDGTSRAGMLERWVGYHRWADRAEGQGALLHYLQGMDLSGFNPRQIPTGEALRQQVEMTALRDPAAAWWWQCLTEGEIRWRDGVVRLGDTHTEIHRANLRQSYEQSAPARGRAATDWANVSRKLNRWCGDGGRSQSKKRTNCGGREWMEELAPLSALRLAFTETTRVEFRDES